MNIQIFGTKKCFDTKKAEFRHKGIARKLVQYAYQESGVSSLTVGCADCDVSMYQTLGFSIPLGNLLAFET